MNHPASKPEIKAVAIATMDELRERIKRKSKLKGRQPDDASLAEVHALLGPKPTDGHRDVHFFGQRHHMAVMYSAKFIVQQMQVFKDRKSTRLNSSHVD